MLHFNGCLRVAAFLCGTALTASQVILNLEHLGQPSVLSGIGLAAIAVPIAMAVAVPAIERCWAEHHYGMAAVMLLALFCGVSHTLVVALERSAYTRDTTAAAKSNYGYDTAKKALEGERFALKKLEDALPETLAKRNCAAQCREGLQAQIAAAQARVEAAQRRLDSIGPPIDEHGIERRYGTAAEFIDFWHPLLLPLAIELGSLMLIGFALRCDRDKPQPMPIQKAAGVSKVRDKGDAGGKVVSIASHDARDLDTVEGPAIAAFNFKRR